MRNIPFHSRNSVKIVARATKRGANDHRTGAPAAIRSVRGRRRLGALPFGRVAGGHVQSSQNQDRIRARTSDRVRQLETALLLLDPVRRSALEHQTQLAAARPQAARLPAVLRL